jgi:5-methyltetrahydropteroyltriglutamate--homocysteine methyltransferase
LHGRSFWKGKTSEPDLVASFAAVDEEAWRAQQAAGVQLIALDGTYYDQVLDMVYALGVAPARFKVSGAKDAPRRTCRRHDLKLSVCP